MDIKKYIEVDMLLISITLQPFYFLIRLYCVTGGESQNGYSKISAKSEEGE